MVKQAASDPKHPAYRKLRKVLADDAELFPVPQPAARMKHVGRNAPCVYGSGKKYKQCYRRKGR